MVHFQPPVTTALDHHPLGPAAVPTPVASHQCRSLTGYQISPAESLKGFLPFWEVIDTEAPVSNCLGNITPLTFGSKMVTASGALLTANNW